MHRCSCHTYLHTSFGQVANDALEQVDQRLKQAAADQKIAGASYLLKIDDGISHRYVTGVCDVDDQTPWKLDTIVRIYSMSKPITSVAAMTLFEQGKFELDDPVSKFLPSFANPKVFQAKGDTFELIDAKREVTIRDLMRHTAGYGYSGNHSELTKMYRNAGLAYRRP